MVASPLFLQQAVSERMISSHKWEESLLASKYVGITIREKLRLNLMTLAWTNSIYLTRLIKPHLETCKESDRDKGQGVVLL